jgi:hypothetical protein
MRLGVIRRLLTLAALLPLVVLSSSGGGSSLFRCQLTGVVSAHSCCPEEASGDSAQAVIAPADCCTRETNAFSRPVAEAPAARGEAVTVVIVAVAGGPALSALPPPAPARVFAAEPRVIPRPPILLAKRSLLI